MDFKPHVRPTDLAAWPGCHPRDAAGAAGVRLTTGHFRGRNRGEKRGIFGRFFEGNHGWLVVGPPLWKIWKSIGMIIPNGNIKFMFQTTNQHGFVVCHLERSPGTMGNNDTSRFLRESYGKKNGKTCGKHGVGLTFLRDTYGQKNKNMGFFFDQHVIPSMGFHEWVPWVS